MPSRPADAAAATLSGPVAVLAEGIERWFASEARDLPWRRHRTPWRAFVGEAMLQQTQVARVAERFEAFMTRFPSPAAMASAGEDAVLASWEGLGYYRRARLLHAAAVRIVEHHGGEVPSSPEALLDLPGVGRYTAGAVASIVFGARSPIVDGNVTRVVARIAGIDARADDPALVATAWRAAEDLVAAATDPGRLNEGLMELGATVCTPATPRCDDCPCRDACRARSLGLAADLPRPKARPIRTLVHIHLVLVVRDERIALEQRPRGGLWGGLWQPPGVQSAQEPARAEVLAGLAAAGLIADRDVSRADLVELATIRRLLTHREVHATLSRLEGVTPRSSSSSIAWHDRASASGLGMAKPVRSLLDEHAWD